ncbi:MAG: DUF805 domain-containing protein [Bacteroidota bacterium]
MKWYLKVLKQFADFKGRARRTEYWMFTLFNIIFAFVTIMLDGLLGSSLGGEVYGVFYLLYTLAMLIPNLAVSVRRLHDTGKTGWMILVGLIPIIGGIWLLVLYCTEGDIGANKYGPDPKNPDSDMQIESHLVENV